MERALQDVTCELQEGDEPKHALDPTRDGPAQVRLMMFAGAFDL